MIASLQQAYDHAKEFNNKRFEIITLLDICFFSDTENLANEVLEAIQNLQDKLQLCPNSTLNDISKLTTLNEISKLTTPK